MFYGGLLFFALLLALRAAAERQMIVPARHFLELAFLDEPLSVQDGISGDNTMVIFPHFREKK
jgi:hypothetical protein